MLLAEHAWTEVADLDTDLAIVPVGSTEQHGPHAPLGTDILTASGVAAAAADHFDGSVLVTPAIPVGVAAEHRQFPGTLWVSPSTFRAYVRETVAALASHGFDRVLLCNGHGGNVSSLEEVAAAITREDEAYAVPVTWFDAADVDDMGHGGPVETSLVWHLSPDGIRTDKLDEAAADAATGWGEWVRGVNLAYDSAEFSENGVVGDPTEASPERGEALLDAAATAVADVLAAVAERDRERPHPRDR